MTYKNFTMIGKTDVQPLVDALNQYPEMWDQNTFRKDIPFSPNKEVNDIWIRFNDPRCEVGHPLYDELYTIWYGAAGVLPVRQYIYQLAHDVLADRIGRVVITKLPPGGEIFAHTDGLVNAQYYQRFHIAINNKPGSVFTCGGEHFTAETGDIYAVNNLLMHSVKNDSNEDRLTMIIDLRTAFLEEMKKTQDLS
jgi:hypothetical protein